CTPAVRGEVRQFSRRDADWESQGTASHLPGVGLDLPPPPPAACRLAQLAFADIVQFAHARALVLTPTLSVNLRCNRQVRLFASLPLHMDPFQKRHAPLATSSGIEAITQLRCNLRPL